MARSLFWLIERISASRMARSNVISGASARTTSPSTKLMTTTGTAKGSHFDHKSHRGRPYDLGGGDLKTRVRPLPSGLDRTRRVAIRAVLVLITACVLVGHVGATAVASGSDGRGAAHSGDGDAGERDHPCVRAHAERPSNQHGHAERPSVHRARGFICSLSPPPRPLASTPPAHGPPPAAPAAGG